MFKRVLFIVIGAFAALSVGAAGAYFAAQVQVADSVIRAGSVAISTVPTTAPLRSMPWLPAPPQFARSR